MRSLSHLALPVVALALVALSSNAYGQPGSPDMGELRLLVFVGAEPASGVTVLVDGVGSQKTSLDGTVEFNVSEGKYKPRLWIPRQLLGAMDQRGGPCIIALREIEVLVGEESEAIVSLGSACEIANVYIESPGSRNTNRAAAEAFKEKLENAPKGTIDGTVVATVDGAQEAVADARVFVRGAPTEAATDASGRFSLELPEGEYDLVVIHARYTTANQKAVKVTANQSTSLEVQVEKATPQLEDFVVTAPYIEGGVATLVAERRESSAVADVIGAEQISRSGDSDAAGALKRVTGITVVGGRFVYVRGMGERYSSTLLNEQFIPSPEPERRVVPLDLFSTNVLESVLVQKTTSPDSPGEFGGGVVRLRTKGYPSEPIAQVSVGTSFNTRTSLQQHIFYDGGGTDFLGRDDGTRAVPTEIEANAPLVRGGRFTDGFSNEELAEFGQTLDANYAAVDERIPLDTGVGLSVGTPFELFGRPAGALFSASYGDQWRAATPLSRNIDQVPGSDGQNILQIDRQAEVDTTERQVSFSGIGVLGAELAPGHTVSSNTLLLRITSDSAATATGFDLEGAIQETRLRFVEQQVFTQQFVGEHEFEDQGATIEWRYAYSTALQDEPDRRQYLYDDRSFVPGSEEDPIYRLSLIAGANQRVWGYLDETLHDARIDYTQKIGVWEDSEIKVKTGGAVLVRDRSFDRLRLAFERSSQAPGIGVAELSLPIEEILARKNVAADNWILIDATQPTDSYTASNDIYAGYAMATVPFFNKKMEWMLGARVEAFEQNVLTFDPFGDEDDDIIESGLENFNVLPSTTLKYNLSDEFVARAGYGRSVTRPSFREVSPSPYIDVINDRRLIGNPDLEQGTIDNYDLRAEYYFSTDELVSLGAFFKDFTNPIEETQEAAADRLVSWDNADGATNLGVEVELFKRLGFLDEMLEEAFLSLNVAFIRSAVELGREAQGIATSANRPLQGQSPFIVNAQLGYDDSLESGTQAVLLYNVFGERIASAGVQGVPDIYEKPYHQLDFVASQRFDNGIAVKFKAQNLIDAQNRFIAGDRAQARIQRGRQFTLTLSYSFF